MGFYYRNMENMLQATNIVKMYGNKKVLDNVSMTINKGDIYGFIGKNGAGKTTFMRVILSLTYPKSGEIKLFGGKSIDQVGLKIGSLIEAPGLYKNLTAYQNLERFSILYGADISKIPEILKSVGLENTGKKKAKDFSLGMRQRLGIAIALLGEPELLLLDEPINGLDPEGIKEIRDLIVKLNKERNITILISSHLLDELAKVVTKYGIIDNGRMVEDIEKSKNILSKEVKEENIKAISNYEIEIKDEVDKASKVNTALVKGGVNVSAIYPNLDSLEEYFMQRIGE